MKRYLIPFLLLPIILYSGIRGSRVKRPYDKTIYYNASAFSTFAEAVDTINASGCTLYIDEPVTITGTETITNGTVVIKTTGSILGGALVLSTGSTLEAGRYQIIGAGGSLTLHRDVVEERYPEWFGAIPGDNVSDVTAIESCINAVPVDSGGVVSFGAGTYTVDCDNASDDIGILLDGDNDNIILRGQGVSTVLQADSNGVQNWFYAIISIQDAKRITIENILFDGRCNDDIWDSNPRLIRLALNGIESYPSSDYAVDEINIRRCKFKNFFESGFKSRKTGDPDVTLDKYTRNVTIDDCYFYDIGQHGVTLSEVEKSKIVNSTFMNMGKLNVHVADGRGNGLAVDCSGGSRQILVSNNVVSRCKHGGFKAETHAKTGDWYSENIVFSNNIIKESYSRDTTDYDQMALRMNGRNVHAINNIIDGFFEYGIVFGDSSKNCTAIGNTITNGDSDAVGIYFYPLNIYYGNKAIGNTIEDCNNIGIWARLVKGVTIESNIVSNCLYDGIQVSEQVSSPYTQNTKNIIVKNNQCFNNGRNGIWVTDTVNYVIVEGNMCYDTRSGASRTQDNGIRIDTEVLNCKMGDNISYNNTALNFYMENKSVFKTIASAANLNIDSYGSFHAISGTTNIDSISVESLIPNGETSILKFEGSLDINAAAVGASKNIVYNDTLTVGSGDLVEFLRIDNYFFILSYSDN